MGAYAGRNPIAEAVRRANRSKTELPPSAGQQILATVSIAGEQQLTLDTHGSGHRRDWGGHIAVATDNLLIYLHDQLAARQYAGAWIDSWYNASRLPKTVQTRPATHGPVMMARAHGTDTVDHVFDAAHNVALIRIGGLTWRIHDQAAWASTERKWREVSALAPLVLPVTRYKTPPKAADESRQPAWAELPGRRPTL
ncbi:hypothetical protein [Nakamurella sp.]|uniref:hypothetical protein n=1 Tax=Nakamurella sp. TaxID=1869182 RepID=UPI003B3B09A9